MFLWIFIQLTMQFSYVFAELAGNYHKTHDYDPLLIGIGILGTPVKFNRSDAEIWIMRQPINDFDNLIVN